MTDKELDDLFKKSFAGHEMPVPDDMWQRVNPQKEKKRRILFWWWTGLGVAALFILVGTAVWLSPASSDKNIKTATASVSLEKEKTTNAQPDKKFAEPEHRSEQTSPVPVTDSAASLSMKPSEQTAGRQYASSYTAKRKTGLHRNTADVLYTKPGKNRNTKTEETTKRIDEQAKEKQAATDSTTIASDEIVVSPLQKSDSINTAASSTAKKETTAAATPVHIKKKDTKSTNIELMIAGYGSDRNVYDAEENAMPVFVSRGTIDPKIKTRLYSTSINMRIDKPVTKNLSFKTGLQFLQTRQRVTYNLESVSQFPVINSLGVTNDTMFFAQIRSQQPVVKSVYNNINVPLLISYHTNGSKVAVGTSAGVIFNLVSWYKGEVPDADYKQTTAARKVFRWNSGASLYMSVHAAKNWGNWQLFAEPHVQYSLSSITKNSASFKQKIASYGLGIGIRKSITKR